MTSNPELAWCVIATASGRERDVQAELHKAGWATYLPLEVVSHRIGRQRYDLRRPLFPRYLFAACLPDWDAEASREIKGLVAVRRRRDGGSLVRQTVMLMLQMAEAAGAFDRRPREKAPAKAFKLEQAVTVTAGPLEGWNGRIVKLLSKREVRAVVDLFGRDCELTFSSAHLEAVGEAA